MIGSTNNADASEVATVSPTLESAVAAIVLLLPRSTRNESSKGRSKMTLDEVLEKLNWIKTELGRGDLEVRQVVFPQILPIKEIGVDSYRGTKYVEIR
jgi:hypothetical protein